MSRACVLALALAACGGAPTPVHAVDEDVRVVSRGTLGYAAAFAGERLVTVELGERFELLVRDEPAARPRALDLGAPERDWPALACTEARCWVGGEAGEVVAVDVATGAEIARWPIGEPVTAIAVAGEHVAIGDASGVLCLRRADDGALLQCVVAHDAPIGAIEPGAAVIVSHASDGDRGWSVPSLATADAAPPAELAWGERRVRADGRRVVDDRGRVVVEMAGAVQDLAASPRGELAVAAWISALDQASVVLVR